MQNAIKKAEEVLAVYNQLIENQRGGSNYNGENWHAVNVKRYSDYVDIEDILKNPLKYSKSFYYQEQAADIAKHSEAIAANFSGDNNDIYFSWLEQCQEMIDEDIINDERLTLAYITEQQRRGDYILFLGRSGGWACFQDCAAGVAEDLDNLLEDIKINQSEANTTAAELKDTTAELQKAVNEINGLKQYILNYNNGLDFTAEMMFRISEFTDELDQEEKRLTRSTDDLKLDIDNIALQAITRVNKFEADQDLKQKLIRQLKSIRAIIEKA